MLSSSDKRSVQTLAEAALNGFPKWAKLLLKIRDGLITPLSLKTSNSMKTDAEQAGREAIGFFPVCSLTDEELIVGVIDSHLTFHMSFLLRCNDSITELVMANVVQCHNRLGSMYLALVLPWHLVIVNACLLSVVSSQIQNAKAPGA